MREGSELPLRERYEQLRAMSLTLDMTRGKPCKEQLHLSAPMLTSWRAMSLVSEIDCRNYGALEGLPEARKLFGAYLGAPAENTYVLGNSSLAIIHDLILQMLLRRVPGESRAWDPHHSLRNRPVMLCLVPGYDRHFSICERYGIEMLAIPLRDDGPDMDAVEDALSGPKRWNIFGMLCTPIYSNPSGVTYSFEVCKRLADMKTWPGFRIFWDLAYKEHHLGEEREELPDMLDLCRRAPHDRGEHSHTDRVFVIGSTSKITFAGAGLAILASSLENLAWYRESLFVQTIGGDKLNQLRHVEFLRSVDGIREHMSSHAAIIKPKFDAALEVFERELGGTGLATWTRPRGGYFITLRVKPGCARKTVELAAKIGVKLTPAGATHPYGKDSDDAWIRFAPTFPPLKEVALGAEAFAICLKMAAES